MRIFTLVGIVLTVVGGFLLYLAFTTPAGPLGLDNLGLMIAGWTLFPMGAIFTLVGLWFGRAMGNRGKLIRQGIPGQATILSLAETGMLINDRPVARMTMNVVVPGRPPYV
ncbi:MAG: hypothetical protein QOH61_1892, partial [Chloroflexota bacterium]|nr:hypothetical protein [Chloroflexota bacterium]